MLRTLDSESVHCCVTSPPYFALRSYLPAGHPDKDREIGSEPTPDAFVEALVKVFREVRRVLHDSGTLWLNLGFGYAGSGKGPTGHNGIGDQAERQGFTQAPNQRGDAHRPNRDGVQGATSLRGFEGFKPKDLMLLPFFVAEALRQDGWYLRSVIAWCKTSAMPESVRDRPSSAWEPIFLLSKAPAYFYDAFAVRQPDKGYASGNGFAGRQGNARDTAVNGGDGTEERFEPSSGANLRNFWPLGPSPLREAHFAAFVPEIPRRAILAGTSQAGVCPTCLAPWRRLTESTLVKSPAHGPGSTVRGRGEPTSVNGWAGEAYPRLNRQVTTLGWQPSCSHTDRRPIPATVLDPFAGVFTTSLAAEQLGRDSIAIELSAEYVELGTRRLLGAAPMFTEIADAPAPPAPPDEPILASDGTPFVTASMFDQEAV